MKLLTKIILGLAVCITPTAIQASAWDVTYSGRLSQSNGSPVDGPVDLVFKFFTAATGGNAKDITVSRTAVPLVQGVFYANLELNQSEYQSLLGDGKETWVEVTDVTNNKVYARQKFSAVPYAMRVPVDGSSISWNNKGELKVIGGTGGGSGTITGVTAGTGLTGGGTSGSVSLSVDESALSIDASQISGGSFPAGVIPNLDATKITTGTLAAARIPNLDASKVTTGQFNAARLPTATGATDGMVTSGDWTTFNNKEPAVTAGVAADYYAGDKTWQTLDTAAVPENGPLYFTPGRAKAATVEDQIVNNTTDVAPSQNAIYDQIIAAKGSANGYAGLDAGGKIPVGQLPYSGLQYSGTWDAGTNTPSLTSGACGTEGNYYITSIGGSTNLDGITTWSLGDWAICSGTNAWQRVGNSSGGVTTVNGNTGATISLDTDDVPEGASNSYYPAADGTKVGYLTVTSATDLDTMRSNVSTNNGKNTYPSGDSTKVGYLTVTAGTNLDTMRSDVAANNSKATYPTGDATKVGYLTVTGATDLDTMRSDVTANNAKVTYPAGDSTKVGHLTVTGATNLDTMRSDVTANNAKVTYPTGDATKVGHLTVTSATNLDTMRSNVTTNNAKVTYPTGDSTKVGYLTVTGATNLDTMRSNVTANNAKTSSQWNTNGSDVHYSTGNVGIGSASPGQDLTVVGNGSYSGYLGIGSNAAPANTAAGDLSTKRFFVNGSTSGTFSQLSGTVDCTANAACPGQVLSTTLSPATDSDSQFRSITISSRMDSSANFDQFISGGYFETRVKNAGDINVAAAVDSFGLTLGAEAATIGTVTDAVGGRFKAVNSFGNTVNGSVSNARGVWIKSNSLGSLSIDNQIGLSVDGMSGATNNTHLLLGASVAPTGNFGIYNNSGFDNYFAGKVGIGTNSPSADLEVHAASGNATIEIQAASSGVGARVDYINADRTWTAGVNTNNKFRIHDSTAGETRLLVDTAGNIGIGTTTPTAKLHITGTPGTDGIKFPDDTVQTTAGGDFFGAFLKRSGGLSTTSGVWTNVTWDIEDTDPSDIHSTSVNTDRITIPAGEEGYYMVTGNCSFLGANTMFGCQIIKGPSAESLAYNLVDYNGAPRINVSGLVYLDANDYVYMQVMQNSGSSLSTDGFMNLKVTRISR